MFTIQAFYQLNEGVPGKKKKKKSLHTGNGSPGSLTDPTTAFLRISPKNQIRRGKVQQGLNFRMDAF